MKEEKIGNVKLNYSFYNTNSIYSDGEIENTILDIVKKNSVYDKILSETNEFAVYYHLAKERGFITEVMELDESQEVLEIGAGCGAITGALASKAHKVDCIELSQRRSMINAYKNKDYSNIEIFVGNYEDVQLEKQYDVITLIGVFEYANYYIHSDNPYLEFLKDIRKKLKDNGKLYIAIENRLGIKYFAGCNEDHADRKFEGIEGYPSYIRAKTFSYYEWLDLIKESEFTNYKFYYPYPDYKFPRQIYSDEFLPRKEENLELASNYMSPREQYFDETKFIKSLVLEKEFKIFANSFFICLRK